MLPGLQRGTRVLRVPEVGRGDDHRVELFLLVEHLAVVLVAIRFLLEPLQGVDDPPQVVLGPDVAHGAEAHAGDAQHRFHEHLPLGAGAEQRDVDLLQIRGGGGRRGGRCRSTTTVLLLAAPGIAEEPERGDRGEPHQQVAPAKLRWRVGCGGYLALSLVVLVSHWSSPGVVLPGASILARSPYASPRILADRCRHHGPES